MTNENVTIALNKLARDPKNVRNTYNPKSIAELAASIEAHGMVQNIVVRKADKKGHFFVTAGARRLKALELLAETGKIAKDHGVDCLLRSQEEASELSLAENIMREAMHPADAYEAYAKLEAEGKSVSGIAVRFGTTETMIRKRLSLGKVSPVLRDLFREAEISFEQLTAFTVSDDHGEQERVWNELPLYNRDAFSIRKALSGEAIRHNDKRIQFIGGLGVYEGAGGAVRRDLFDEDDGGYALDTVKVEAMVAEKFAAIEAEVREEGWAWTLVMPTMDYDYVRTLDRKYPETVALSEADQSELDRLTAEYDELAELIEPDVADDTAESKLEELQTLIDALESRQHAYAPDVVAKGGVIISLNYHGNASIERGFIKPEAADDQEQEESEADGSGNTAKPAGPILTHSATLVHDLTAQKTAALRIELANNPDIALAAVVHAMLLKVAYTARREKSALQIGLTCEQLESSMKNAASCRALEEMEKLRESYGNDIPGNPAELWQWCLNRNQSQLLDLLAYAAAQSVNAVETKFTDRQSAFSHANQLGPVGPKLRFWPTRRTLWEHILHD